jgi:hypothetical protein
MTWIKTNPPGPDHPDVAAAMSETMAGYPTEYAPSRRGERRVPEPVMNDSIVLSHSLIPDALRHAFGAHKAIMDPAMPLSRAQHEMIAATVSSLNRCFY